MNQASLTEQRSDGTHRSHRLLAELQYLFSLLPPPPADVGRLAMIVCRRAPGAHESMNRIRLSLEDGVPGDEWNRRLPKHTSVAAGIPRRNPAKEPA